jgi:hypothetical protein
VNGAFVRATRESKIFNIDFYESVFMGVYTTRMADDIGLIAHSHAIFNFLTFNLQTLSCNSKNKV